jgi:hypothetical protein
MIYGKRVVESHQWLYQKGPSRPFHIVDKTFQWKYTLYLTSAVAGSTLLFLVPAWYFVNQNYDLFISLADKTEPALFEHLQRESTWLLAFLILAGASIFSFCIFLGLRLTESVIGPLISLERHMRKVTRGDLAQKDFSIREKDDFRSLANTYSYMFKSLRAQAEQDLRWLEKIVIDPRNPEALAAWKTLVRTKQAQLSIKEEMNPRLMGGPSELISEQTFVAPGSRRAS